MIKRNNDVVVAIYVRVSTTEQAQEGYSIGEQERLLMKHCSEHGYTVYKCYADKGISGKNITGRPAMQELLSDAKERKFSMVISWKLNRISRSLKDIIEINDILEKNGIQYKSITENFETQSPAGKMLFQMLAAVGELERNQIAENVKMGLCARARDGKWCGGQAPLGYRIERTYDGKRSDCYLSVNEQEASIVRHIFSCHLKGWGYKRIANDLNGKGMKSKKGNLFAISTIRDILCNPTYAGYIRYNYRQDWEKKRRAGINPNPIIVKGIHQPIISEEMWEKSTLIMQTKTRTVKKHNGFYPLTGILRCPQCGSGMVLGGSSQNGKRIFYYVCGAFHTKGSSACRSNGIRCDKANDIVFERLCNLLNNEKVADFVIERYMEKAKTEREPLKKQFASIKGEKEKLEKAVEKLFELYEMEVISREEFQSRKATLDDRICQLKMHEEEVQQKILENSSPFTADNICEILKRFKEVLVNAEDQQEVRLLMQLLIKKITIDKNRDIDSIVLHINNDLIEFLYAEEGELPAGISPFLCGKIEVEMVI